MSEESLNYLGNMLTAFLDKDEETRNSAIDAFFEHLNNDPATMINQLFEFIVQNDSCTARLQALIRAKHFLYTINIKEQVNTISEETYQNIMSALVQLLEKCNLDGTEIQYVFLIISSFMKNFIIPGYWPQIFDIMLQFVESPFCSYAIKFFSDYFSYVNPESNQIPEGLISKVPELIKFDSPDPNVIISSISLSFQLVKFPDFRSLLESIPQAIFNLPDMQINPAIDLFDGFYQFNFHYIAEYKDGFTAVMLQIAQNTDREEFCRISPLEILEKMLTRDSQVRNFLNENLEELLKTLSICFELDDLDNPIYNSASLLLEEYLTDDESKNAVASAINGQSLPIPILSAFYRYILDVQYIDQLIEFAQNPDPVVSQNAFETIELLLKDKYPKLTKKQGIIQQLIDLLFAYVESVEGDTLPGLSTLAQLAESLSEYNKEKLQSIAPQLLQVQDKFLNSDSMRCAAAVASAFPQEVSQQLSSFASKSMELILNGADENSAYALMIAVSTFAKGMQDYSTEDFNEFVSQLMNLVREAPNISTFTGLRIIAKQIGEPFTEFLPSFIPYLINVAVQDIEHYYNTQGDYTSSFGYMSYSLPGGIKLEFRNEQMADIANALESLADYANAVGNNFAEYCEQADAAAVRGIGIVYDTQVRISAVKLFSALSKSCPNYIPGIFDALLKKILGNGEDEQQDPEIEVQAAIMEAIQAILENEQCPPDVRTHFLTVVPRIYQLTIDNIQSDMASNDFEGVEHDNYLNLLWSIASSMKALYEKNPEEAGATFIQLTEMLPPFQGDTILLLRQFSLAVWSDFLVYGSEKYVSQCEETMIPQVMELVNSPDNDLRAVALYTIGRIFVNKEIPPSELDKILGVLYVAATNERAQEDESLFQGNDNALSSYALLLKKRIPMGDSAECINQFIQMFPAEDDIDEAKVAYSFLFELFWEAGNNEEISFFIDPIREKLAEGLEIESLAEPLKAIIEEKLKEGNVPPQVSQFLSLDQ